jgi:dipeptidyl aminopeptidase/acylaminoacyl peptidase
MRKTRICGILLPVVLVLSVLAGCQTEKANQAEPAAPAETAIASERADIYNMESYESDEVFGFVKVNQGGKYDAFCTTYKFNYLSDGLKIEGYLSVPLSVEKTQKPGKCAMYNHGGNRDYGKLENNTTAPMCVVCDRIVIASQYRGCGGSEGEDHFGGDDLNDVIKLIDLCENTFSFIDMDDFCVLGASRGGVMTYPAARKDSRIKRIITIGAVSDLIESYEARDDMKDVLKETIGFTPEENPEEYKKRSAVYWADEINIPVLIFHAKHDPLVPYGQAEKLYEILKSRIDCTLISYDDDSHAEVKPEDYQTILDWLNQ